MLPHPDTLSIPLKEGIRDLRCSIRLEARSGAVASRVLGSPRPTRRLATLADSVLSRVEHVASRVLPRDESDLGQRLDRLMAALRRGGEAERPGDLYAVCREIPRGADASGVLVSELKLARRPARPPLATDADLTLAAVMRAHEMASAGVLRGCLSATLLPGAGETGGADRPALRPGADEDAALALTCWLAVLVRFESMEEGRRVLNGASLAVDAEGEGWTLLLRERRFAELAGAWRRTVPYLP
ncbi:MULTISPECIES: hypothetical protein [unclassified Aureimonas]|uniref:hypothetical protein n=1 Tax=unclassified Aureimonas TaxID=2615206 RepID=UPI0006FDCCE0|nr:MULTISPECIES: hypothetical protein [unclassified Aureimonas]KQT52418.1 hypothetical protein ASG62_14415 [Aureimonas sp. Leaf427]KQT74935.1 hypothetical protein ASG54_16260 [Aureimonas sp. Leaf460]